MARPKIPLVDRRDVIAKALDIIDREGFDALSLRKLGSELGVTGAALYHHFTDKNEILRGVAELVLAKEVILKTEEGSWEDFVLISITRFRAALLAHPNTAPLMTWRFGETSIDNAPREFVLTKMLDQGVPERYCYPIIDSAEMLAFGSAVMNPRQLSPSERLQLNGADGVANMRRAVEATHTSADQLFQLELNALLCGWKALIEKLG